MINTIYPTETQTVLLTVSFNAVDYESTPYFVAREAWASSKGVRHIYLTEQTTGLRLDAHCSAWLRIPVILLLPQVNVFYIDTDCLIDPSCPHPSEITGRRDGLFIALGHSGRPNSGVMIANRGREVFEFCIKHYCEQPPEPHRAPWENGHVIWGCATHGFIHLGPEFNVTNGTGGKIIHHTGPNRSLRTMCFKAPSGEYDFSQSNVNNSDALRRLGSQILSTSCFASIDGDHDVSTGNTFS
jgi:hypothetical protein